MMAVSLAFMAFLTAQVAQPALLAMEAVQPSPGSDIVVTGRKLRDFRAVVKTRRNTGEPYCQLRRSSGDPSFDTELCALMVKCHVNIENSTALRMVREGSGSRKDVERVWVTQAERCMARFLEEHGLSDE